MFAAAALRPLWFSCLAVSTGAIAWGIAPLARGSELPAVSTSAADLKTQPASASSFSSLWQTDSLAAERLAALEATPLQFDPTFTTPVPESFERPDFAAALPPTPAGTRNPFQFQSTPAPEFSGWLSQTNADAASELDLEPEIIEDSPVLQRWLEEIPDVLQDIRHDPSFRSRVRLGYSYFPSSEDKSGWIIGLEDFFIGNTGLTVSAEYQGAFAGGRETWGGDLRYYVLPLGSYINVAPVLGYRNITTDNYHTDGVNVGAKLILALSRTGAADISISQTFVSPGSADEVGITTLSTGYAVTEDLRISVDLQKQNSVGEKDSRVGLVFEWML